MESSIAEFLSRKLACELLPTAFRPPSAICSIWSQSGLDLLLIWSPSCPRARLHCWAEAPIKIARMTLTIKLDGNWSSFQLANSAPPLSVTDSAIAPSARMNQPGCQCRAVAGGKAPWWAYLMVARWENIQIWNLEHRCPGPWSPGGPGIQTHQKFQKFQRFQKHQKHQKL